MKTSIQFLAVLCAATITSMSFAQTQSTPIRLVDARGCEIYVPSSATVKEMTIANAVGECRSGKFDGGVLVGIGWDLAVPGQEVKSFIGMRAGVVSQGRFTGLRLSLNQEATLFLNGPNNEPELTRRFKQSEPGYSIEQVVSAIEELLPKAVGNTSDGARSFLVNLVRTWDRSPFDMMRSYTANWGQTTQNMAWVGLPPEQRQAYAASQANTSNQSTQSNSGITASKVETAAEILNGVNNLLRASRGQAPLSIGSTSTGTGTSGSLLTSTGASSLGAGTDTSANCRGKFSCNFEMPALPIGKCSFYEIAPRSLGYNKVTYGNRCNFDIVFSITWGDQAMSMVGLGGGFKPMESKTTKEDSNNIDKLVIGKQPRRAIECMGGVHVSKITGLKLYNAGYDYNIDNPIKWRDSKNYAAGQYCEYTTESEGVKTSK